MAASQENIRSAVMSEELLWYCVKTRRKQESLTARSLRSDVQIEIFAPSLRFQRSRGRGKMWVTEALFPGYLFARFAYRDAFRHVRATRGVSTIVGFGGVPSIVPDSIIHTLRNSVSAEETVVIEPEVAAGDEINVVEGVFAGLRAVVTRVLPARQRILILLELLGCEREVEVALADVLLDSDHPLVGTRQR